MTTDSTPSKEQLAALLKADVSQFNQLRRDISRLDVDLGGADLQGASLRNADLGRANLTGANLSRSDLTNANLHRAKLERADLRGSTLGSFAGDPCMRYCLHEASFRDVHFDKSQLEEILAIINSNADWEIKYDLVPKK